MKRLFSLFILLILVGFVKVSADNATTVKDSLLKVLRRQPKGEPRLNTLYSLARLDLMSPSCLYYLDKLLEEATELKDEKNQCLAMYAYVVYYYNHQDENSTTVWMDKLATIALESKQYNYYFAGKRADIAMHTIKHKIEYSITEAEEMYKQAKKLGNTQGMISAKLCLMTAYLMTARFKEGEEVGFEAYRLLPADASLEERARILQEITLACSSTKNKDILNYLHEYESVLDELSHNKYEEKISERGYLLIETLYADYYLDMNDLDKVRIHLKKMDLYYSPSNFLTYKGLYHNVYSRYYQITKEYDKALEHSGKTIEFLSDLSDDGGLNHRIRQAGILGDMGRIDESVSLFKQLLAQKDSFYNELSTSQMDEIYQKRNMDDLILKKEQHKKTFHYIGFILIAITLSIMIPATIRIYLLRKRLIKEERKIQKLNLVTEEANEMKGNFLANMSYNIRVSLNNVLGFSQIITQENENISDEEWKEYSEIIQTNSNDLINMVNNVLDLSRLEAGKTKWQIQEYDIIILCSDVISMLRMQDGGKIDLDFQTDIESLLIPVDVARFTQLLLSTLTYPDSCDEERAVSFSLFRDNTGKYLVFRIVNSPIADPEFQNSKVEICHSMNRLTIEYFKGTYSVVSDAENKNMIVFTYPCSI